MRINKHDTNGTKPLLGKGELGYDDYTAGGDVGRVYVGTGAENIALAEKLEVDSHVSKVDNPHSVTKAQVGLGNVDNTADANKNVLSAAKWTTARTITLSGDVTGSVSMDGTANVSITTTVQPNSVALGTDTTGNYVAGVTAGTGITVSGTASEGWSPTVAITNVGTAGTYTKVTTNAQGQVTSGTSLAATDIPNLDASKITSGTIDAARLPAYVDDVLEFANLASFPATGESGKIYVALDTNKTYRWSGSVYVYITSGAVDSVNGQTGVVNITTITGNSGTATKLQTARTINGVSFDGTADIDIEDRLGTAIASAATTTIGTRGLGDYIHITGTTTITSFGTAAAAGVRRTLIFDGALTLTHNATSLICPGAANIVTVAGTIIEVVAETTANWRVVSITHPSLSMAELSYLDGVTSAIQTQLNAKAALASPALSGIPTAPTAAVGTSTTQIASTAFVNAEIANDAVLKVISTDNAIVRFNGTTGDVQNSSITIDDLGNLGNGTQTFNGFGGTGFKNYIINGNFDVWQRGTSFSVGYTGANVYHIDRFISASSFSTGNVRIDKSSITYNNVKYNSAKYTVTTAYNTSGSSSAYRHFCYFFEGIDSTVVNKGFTLSFLFNTNVAGTYTVSFKCEGDISSVYKTRITAISGIQKITIVVPANTITTPTLDTNLGLQICIAGVAGSTYGNLSTTLNQWDSSITTLYYPNEMNWAGTVGNYIEIAQVQLEEGSVATPFEQRPYGLELSLCQRYYETNGSARVEEFRNTTTGITQYGSVRFITQKRSVPTIFVYSDNLNNVNQVAQNDGVNTPCSIASIGDTGFRLSWTNSGGRSGASFTYTASAEL